MPSGLATAMSDLRRELHDELGESAAPPSASRHAPSAAGSSQPYAQVVAGGLAAAAVAVGVCALALAPTRRSARVAQRGSPNDHDDPLFQPLR
jgi:hypothetical protein